jgi:hypothetical protein
MDEKNASIGPILPSLPSGKPSSKDQPQTSTLQQNTKAESSFLRDSPLIRDARPLGEQSLGERVEAVDASLNLGGRRSSLEPNGSVSNAGLQVRYAGDSRVLKRVLETRVEVGDELLDATLVGDVSRNSLGNLDGVGLREVARRGGVVVTDDDGVGGEGAVSRSLGVLHGLDRTHTSVGLDSLALVVEVVSGRLGRSSEESTHHDGAGTERERLGDVTDVSNTSVGPDGNSELPGKLGDTVDGGTLGSTDGHDLLGDTDGSGSHTDSETVSSSLDELGSLLSSDDVSGNDVNVGEGLLDPLDHLDLEGRVSLRRVDDDDVESGLDEKAESLSVGRSGSDGGTTVELLGRRLLAGERVVLVLEQVRSGDEGGEVSSGVDDGELTLSGVSEDSVGLLKGSSDGGGNDVGNHDVGENSGGSLELDVSASNDTDELASDLSGVW